MGIFKELGHSMYDCKSYSVFLKDKKRKTFLYAVLLILLYYFFTIGIPVIRFRAETGGLIHIVHQYLPDFRIAGGRIEVDDVVEYEDDEIYVFINTAPGSFLDEEEVIRRLRSRKIVIVMDSEQLVLQGNGEFQNVYYEDLDPDLYLTKALLLETARPYVNGILAVGLVLVFLFMAAAFFLGVLVVALICMIVVSCMKYTLTFGEVYKLAVYTRTLPLAVKAAISFLPFGIPMFFIINFGISVCIFAGAVRAMKGQKVEDQPLKFYSEGMEPEEERYRWRE